MKKICFLIMSFLIINSCDDNKKIIHSLKAKKELKLSFFNEEITNGLNFLFIIDTSASMDEYTQSLSDNINFFLGPILKKYPYYNYHFAFTTMTPADKFTNRQLPLYAEEFSDICGHLGNMKLKKSNMGHYFQYYHGLSKEELDTEKLFCLLKSNTTGIKGFDGSSESYFQSLNYILNRSDLKFKKDFFSKDKNLILFFISDASQGVTYYDLHFSSTSKFPNDKIKAAEYLSDKQINKLKSFGILENLISYAAVPSLKNKDTCEENLRFGGGKFGPGKRQTFDPNRFPFHVYKFIEKTSGLILSLCDGDWGKKLDQASDDFLSSFKTSLFFLDEFPERETIEVYFNDIKMPYDSEAGWFFNPEKVAVQIGSKIDWSYYLSLSSKDLSESELRILYHPLNLNLFQEGSEK